MVHEKHEKHEKITWLRLDFRLYFVPFVFFVDKV